MTFLVQFIRFRRGGPEVVRTLPIAAENEVVVLQHVKERVGTSFWPMNAEALRVMDSGGRTLLDWVVPAPTQDVHASSELTPKSRAGPNSQGVEFKAPDAPRQRDHVGSTSAHPLNVGQAVSFTEDGGQEDSKGGYQIVGLADTGGGEAQYVIRSADQTSNQVAKEHELQEDLGERTRGR
jgi:hypothetical protein